MKINGDLIVSGTNKKLDDLFYDSGWIYPELQNGWETSIDSTRRVGYRKINGIVYLKGTLFNNSYPEEISAKTIFVLPQGFRPSGYYDNIIVRDGGAHIGLFFINYQTENSGICAFEEIDGIKSNEMSLTGISFPADY